MVITALIVDDEPDIRSLIALALGRIGLDTHTAANLEEATNLLAAYAFDVCLTDMRLPDGSGLDLVRRVQNEHPGLPIAVITAHGNTEAAVEAMKAGAFDFVSKPVDIGRLRGIVVQATERAPPAHTVAPLPSGPSDSRRERRDPTGTEHVHDLAALSGRRSASTGAAVLLGGERLIGRSASMNELRRLVAKVARTNAPVWITGESGTGKELIARLIHENGPRAHAPFVAINCGAIPADLMESELFGHRKGSFTGAVADNEGLFRSAEGGTLFLDEVAELPLHMQVKLLRAVQERSVRPVGAAEELAVDVRVLSASHKDLSDEVEAGRFRHDLYYRLNVVSLRAPSLRERTGDIATLAAHVLDGLSSGAGRAPALSSAALSRLEGYRFPGNVRELENLLERAATMIDGDVIEADDLTLRPDQCSRLPPDGVPERRIAGEPDERQRLVDALETTHWNRKAAADLVGLTYRQFRYRLVQMDITGPGGR